MLIIKFGGAIIEQTAEHGSKFWIPDIQSLHFVYHTAQYKYIATHRKKHFLMVLHVDIVNFSLPGDWRRQKPGLLQQQLDPRWTESLLGPGL